MDYGKSLNIYSENFVPADIDVVPFHLQVGKHSSDRLAVTDTFGGSLTYLALLRLAVGLARRLRKVGVHRGSIVPLLVGRTVNFFVGRLAISCCGAAFVPLADDLPVGRIKIIAELSGATVAVSEKEINVDGLTTVLFDGTADDDLSYTELCEQYEREDAAASNVPLIDSPVYVRFTSGSTGTPKGVVVTHRCLSLSIIAMHKFGIGSADTVSLIVAQWMWDFTEMEAFVLAYGGQVVIAGDDHRRSGVMLAQLMAQHKVNMASFTPTLAQQLLASGWPGSPDLFVILAGERLSTNVARAMLPFCKTLINLYGPTETTIVVTGCRVTEEVVRIAESRGADVPIGEVLAGTVMLVVDDNMKPVPPGMVGHMIIGTPQSALGYLNDERKTDKVFVNNCFTDEVLQSATPEVRAVLQRIYLSGDLGYLNDEKLLVYTGRRDHQVKFRGFRLELGEIESLITQEVAVVLQNFVENQPRLVAFVVMKPDVRAPTPRELRLAIGGFLQSEFVPTAVMQLPKLPLTETYKLDRNALENMPVTIDPSDVEESAEFVAPRNQIEGVIATGMAMLLKVPSISVTADFFESGGSSLLSMRMIGYVRNALKVDIPVSAILRARTTEALAAYVTAMKASRTQEPETPRMVILQEGTSKINLVFFHPAVKTVIGFGTAAVAIGAEQTVLGIEPRKKYDDIRSMAADYAQTIMSYCDNYVLCGYSFGGTVAFATSQVMASHGRPPLSLILLDVRAPRIMPRDRTLDRHAMAMAMLTKQLLYVFGQDVPVTYADLLPVAPDDRLQFIVDTAIRLKIVPPDYKTAYIADFAEDLLDAVMQEHAYEKFLEESGGVYDGAMVHIRTSRGADTEGIMDELFDDPSWGWQPLSSSTVKVSVIDGSHFTIIVPPDVHVLAKELRNILAELS